MPFGKAKKEREPLTYDELLDYALKSLASKMKSERDLRRKLAERADPDTVDQVLAKLKELSYLSDERFAADFARLRQENEKLGRRRVQQSLMQKGIAPATVSNALSTQYDALDEATLARQYIERKRLKPPSGDREQKQKETARIMRRLVTAGFSSRAVWKVLHDWAGSDLTEDDIQSEE